MTYKKYVNGQYVDMTEEEIVAMKTESKRAEAQEKHRLLSTEEVTRLLLKEQLNTIVVDDQTAVRMVEFYPTWQEMIGKTTEIAGFKFSYNGKLYKTVSVNHTFVAHWIPGVGTESLYTRIDEQHEGDLYDPVPYEGNMELFSGMYYTQGGVIYLCNRDTDAPVHNTLNELVGLYVEVVQA